MLDRTLPAAPARGTPARGVDPPRHHADRRLCVAARRQLARTDARPRRCSTPSIRAYLEAENAYAKAALAHTEPLQEKLFAEMKGRIKEDNSTVPSPDGPHAYFIRYREGGQHPIACREPRGGGPEQVLLDGDALAAGKAFFQFGGMQHSPGPSPDRLVGRR